MIKELKWREGFTLVEALIAIALLGVGIVGLVAIYLNSVKAGHTANLHFMATDIMTSEIEEIKLLGYVNLTKDNLTMAPFNYRDSLASLPLEYRFPGIDVSCNAPFDYCLYRGVLKTAQTKGQVRRYLYTIKLSVDEDYLDTPTLKRLRMQIFGVYGGRLKESSIIFMVERR